LFPVNPTEYTEKKVLAVPRCCQHKKGTQDREVAERDCKIRVCKLDTVIQDTAAQPSGRDFPFSLAR
jgi:hypothetical protein